MKSIGKHTPGVRLAPQTLIHGRLGANGCVRSSLFRTLNTDKKCNFNYILKDGYYMGGELQ